MRVLAQDWSAFTELGLFQEKAYLTDQFAIRKVALLLKHIMMCCPEEEFSITWTCDINALKYYCLLICECTFKSTKVK